MSSRESPESSAESESFAEAGERLAAEGRVIADEVTAVLADALAAVLADAAELAALPQASARDAVAYLVRLGRMTREEGDAVVRRAGCALPASGPASDA